MIRSLGTWFGGSLGCVFGGCIPLIVLSIVSMIVFGNCIAHTIEGALAT
jgi:hypothetical protein